MNLIFRFRTMNMSHRLSCNGIKGVSERGVFFSIFQKCSHNVGSIRRLESSEQYFIQQFSFIFEFYLVTCTPVALSPSITYSLIFTSNGVYGQ